MTIFATAGAKIYIGGVMKQKGTNFVLADFTTPPQTWVEINETEGLGSLGDSSEAITFTGISDARARTLKGSRSAGTMELVCGIDPADPGQIALIAAEKTIHDYAFKLVLNDAPAGGTPSERYFIAKILSQSEQFDQANSVMKLNASLAVNSNVVRVDAAISGSAPDNTVLPAITGTAEVGQTLTASSGTWVGSPTPTYAYQWFADGESLPGATGTTLVLTEDHEEAVITVAVTATNANGQAIAISSATSAVTS